MPEYFKVLRSLDQWVNHRKGEVKLGERFQLLKDGQFSSLPKHKRSGARFALLGIPESIGIQANHGVSGAENSWEQCLRQLLNHQSNRYLDGISVLCLGQVETKDLQQRASELNQNDRQYFTKLRSLCQELDQRVAPVIEQTSAAGLIPIVIGGGHNNSYPILKGLTKGLSSFQGINCINLDAHADFRPLEGRHSGNGFSYAFYQGYLQRYFVIGLNAHANSESMLKNMDLEEGVDYEIYQPGVDPQISNALKFVSQVKGPTGIEIDLDVISFMPASAFNTSGFGLDQIRRFIRDISKELKPAYLHLAEGQVTDNHRDDLIIGKTLSTLVLDFIKHYPL